MTDEVVEAQALFPNCTITTTDDTGTLRIEPTMNEYTDEYCAVISDYITTLGFEVEVITEPTKPTFIQAVPQKQFTQSISV